MNYESTVDYRIVNLVIDHAVTHRHRHRDLTHVLHRHRLRWQPNVSSASLAPRLKLMTVLARAAGHHHLSEFSIEDLTTYKADMAQLTGVAYGGVAG